LRAAKRAEVPGVRSGLRFATWILLALEFALAADIVRTPVAPTWDDISKLAVIATIRTMLNYFLAKDITAFDYKRRVVGNGRTQLKSGRIRPVNQLDASANMWFSPLSRRARARCEKRSGRVRLRGFRGFPRQVLAEFVVRRCWAAWIAGGLTRPPRNVGTLEPGADE
jgi:hypothetical protein